MAWKILHHPFKCKICCHNLILVKLVENASLEWRYLRQQTPRRLLKSSFFNKYQKFIGKRGILIDNLDNGVKTTIFSSLMSKLITFMIFYKILLISAKFESVIPQTLTRIWSIGREVIVQKCASWSFVKVWTKKTKIFLSFSVASNLSFD